MKKIIIISVAALALASCGNRNQRKKAITAQTATEQATTAADTHNSRNSLDYTGTYQGTVPCADCPGIEVTLKVEKDGNFTKRMKYIDRDGTLDSKGSYAWDSAGKNITITDETGSREMYKVGENRLIMLDGSGNAITGDHADKYVLTKK